MDEPGASRAACADEGTMAILELVFGKATVVQICEAFRVWTRACYRIRHNPADCRAKNLSPEVKIWQLGETGEIFHQKNCLHKRHTAQGQFDDLLS